MKPSRFAWPFAISCAVTSLTNAHAGRDMSLEVRRITVFPVQPTGQPWDHVNRTFQGLVSALADFSGVPVLHAIASIADLVSKSPMGSELPEPMAWLSVQCGGPESTQWVLRPGELTDTWNAVVHMQPISITELSRRCSISLNVDDFDRYNQNERIAHVEISQYDIKRALKARSDYCIDFREISQGALVAACIRVREQARP